MWNEDNISINYSLKNINKKTTRIQENNTIIIIMLLLIMNLLPINYHETHKP